MPKRSSEETIELIDSLCNQNVSIVKIAMMARISYLTALGYAKSKKGSSPYQEHLKHSAEERINPKTEKPFGSLTEYHKYLAEERGFKSLHEYQKHLIIEKGFESYTKYHKHLAKKRQDRELNKLLSDFIVTGLRKKRKNQSWLANQLNVTRQAVSIWKQGKDVPRGKNLENLLNVLDVNSEILTEKLENQIDLKYGD